VRPASKLTWHMSLMRSKLSKYRLIGIGRILGKARASADDGASGRAAEGRGAHGAWLRQTVPDADPFVHCGPTCAVDRVRVRAETGRRVSGA
jgi:hypothetical protein